MPQWTVHVCSSTVFTRSACGRRGGPRVPAGPELDPESADVLLTLGDLGVSRRFDDAIGHYLHSLGLGRNSHMH